MDKREIKIKDIVLAAIIFVLICSFYGALVIAVPPFNRGFFCDDKSIQKPYATKQTVPNTIALVAGVGMVVAGIVALECYNYYKTPSSVQCDLDEALVSVLGCCRLRAWVIRTITRIFAFGFGALCNAIITEIGKLMIGRLRPHFLAACKPDHSLFNCSQGFITVDVCTGTAKIVTEASTLQSYALVRRLENGGNAVVGERAVQPFCLCPPDICPEPLDVLSQGCEKKLDYLIILFDPPITELKTMIPDAVKKSFPSGHSSFSAFTMVFLALYIEYVWVSRRNGFAKSLMQLITICLALACGFSRISDYFHHWSDVLTGFLLGTIYAFYTIHRFMSLPAEEKAVRMQRTAYLQQDIESGQSSTCSGKELEDCVNHQRNEVFSDQ